MEISVLLLLALGIFIIAVLYSSVGHAGASGYIAVMSLMSLSPEFIKPAALTLNIFVASIAFWQFYRAGHFRWTLFWPFIVLSIPMAFLGGYLNLPTRVFHVVIGVILLFSAVRFVLDVKPESPKGEPSRTVAVTAGGALGFLAGLTGTGGGIFLTPLLLIMRWATAKIAAAVSALFILFNSASGLAGNIAATLALPVFTLPLAVAAIAGGSIGSWVGSRKMNHRAIKRLLAVVLLIAGLKLLFS